MGVPPSFGTGEMTRATGLSLKALRLYDANGLLVPARVDPLTGYRAYGVEQVARGRAIGLLRRLDLPLARIGELLDGPPEELHDALVAWWAERDAAWHEERLVVDLVGHALGAGPARDPGPGTTGTALEPVPASAVRLRSVPERRVASISRTVEQRELVAAFTADVLAVRAQLDAQGARHDAEFWVVYHELVGPGRAGRIETCVPYAGRVEPVGPLVLRVEPAARVAQVPVPSADCSYPRIGAYYATVLVRAEELGGAQGPPREEYPVPWRDGLAEVARVVVAVPADAA